MRSCSFAERQRQFTVIQALIYAAASKAISQFLCIDQLGTKTFFSVRRFCEERSTKSSCKKIAPIMYTEAEPTSASSSAIENAAVVARVPVDTPIVVLHYNDAVDAAHFSAG